MEGIESYLGGSPLLAIGAAFAAGVLTSLSPCIYPMIPIVSAYVAAKSAGAAGRGRSLALSLAYVVGMAIVYALLGMIAALTGRLFGMISTSPWTLFAVGCILSLFALQILELISLPALLGRRTLAPAAGGLVGAFLVGATSGLVASPCVSPVLMSLLTYVAGMRSVVYGGALLFSFSLGMGALLVATGTFSGLGAALPRPGRWMVLVKKGGGVLLLCLAVHYLLQAGRAWY